jgi:hypothetical protein
LRRFYRENEGFEVMIYARIGISALPSHGIYRENAAIQFSKVKNTL